jgi:hypothetical protein
MRRIRPLLVAGALVLAVGIGTTVALTTRQAPTATASPPAAQPMSPTTGPGDPPAPPTPAPRILEVTTSPRLHSLEGDFWLELPPGAGTVVFSVKATNAQHVRFTLTPTGNETGPYGKLLGEDRDPSDGFTLLWRYPAEGISAHLGIQAIGPGGTTDKSFGIAH